MAGAKVTVFLGPAPSVDGDPIRHHGGYVTEVAGPIVLVSPPDSNLPPSFGIHEVFLSIPELTPPGVDIGLPVEPINPEGHSLNYRLGGPRAARFGIEQLTGQLLTQASLNFEAIRRYTLLIGATDQFGARDVITVSVAVVDVDEPPAIIGPAAVSFPEQHTGIVAEYAANDPDRNAVHWELHGQDRDNFMLDEGVLRFREPPRYESPTDADADIVYHVSIEVPDDALTATLDVAVSVQKNARAEPRTGGSGGGGGGGGPPPIPIPSDEDFDWNVTRDIESLDRDNDLSTVERRPQRELALDPRNRFSHGIWSDGVTVWVADSGQDRLFA